VDRHIHALFQENYKEYLRPFPLTRPAIDHWKNLIQDALPEGHANDQAQLTVLDVGSGDGLSVFPLIELFPNAEIVASDLSIHLLRDLRSWHQQHYPNHKHLWLLQLNAEDIVFEDSQIDLVTGAFVLHHLRDLVKCLAEIRRVLKPGGVAIFWEGFEGGCQIVSLVMQLLIAKNEAKPRSQRIGDKVIVGFYDFIADVQRRKGECKSPELLDALEDKWLFTQTQIEKDVRKAGFELIAVRSVYSPDALIATMVDHELRRRLHELAGLPRWAQELVAEIDGGFSRELKSEILYGAVVIVRKPDHPFMD
jgi:ubiquinone/menaquinone biosynthesis C-methylase UbiE